MDGGSNIFKLYKMNVVVLMFPSKSCHCFSCMSAPAPLLKLWSSFQMLRIFLTLTSCLPHFFPNSCFFLMMKRGVAL